MVVFSLLVIVISSGFLAAGIVGANDTLVMGSIVLSIFAAVVLFIGVWRQRTVSTASSDRGPAEPALADDASPASPRAFDKTEKFRTEKLQPIPRKNAVVDPRDEEGMSGTLESSRLSEQEEQARKGLESVAKTDHAAWARSAVASLVTPPTGDEVEHLLDDRRRSTSDVATAIPQLMSASSTLKRPSSPPSNPNGTSAQPETPSTPPTGVAGEVSGSITAANAAEQLPATALGALNGQSGSSAGAVIQSAVAQSSVAAMATQVEVTQARTATASLRSSAAHGDTATAANEPEMLSELAKQPESSVPQDHEIVVDSASVQTDASSDLDEYPDPPDEPPAELLLSYEERQLTECSTQVLVVDGRPRFHLKACPHLSDKTAEPLVLAEAAELGFTSCSLCAAATTVLAAKAKAGSL